MKQQNVLKLCFVSYSFPTLLILIRAMCVGNGFSLAVFGTLWTLLSGALVVNLTIVVISRLGKPFGTLTMVVVSAILGTVSAGVFILFWAFLLAILTGVRHV